jgi:hypothetical protein
MRSESDGSWWESDSSDGRVIVEWLEKGVPLVSPILLKAKVVFVLDEMAEDGLRCIAGEVLLQSPSIPVSHYFARC